MSAPLFSIVTVTLNAGEAAIKTAKSVLAQTYTDYEYIVKDGLSSDGLIERLRQMSETINIQVSADDGLYHAMNQALQLCMGDYVCFLNAGDFFFSSAALETIAYHIKQQNYPDFVYNDNINLARHFLEGENGRRVTYPDKISRFYLFRKIMICHQTWFVRRDILQHIGGFNTTFQVAADYNMLVEMLLKYNVRYYHCPITTIVYEGNGVSIKMARVGDAEVRQVRRLYYSKIERIAYYLILTPYWLLVRNLNKFYRALSR